MLVAVGILRPLLLPLALVLTFCQLSIAQAAPKKIVLIAGKKSHGPEGNGIHDYPWSVKLMKVMLDNSNVRDAVRVEYHLNGWPSDARTLDDADTIMIVSDGRDGDLYEEAPHLASDERVSIMRRQVARGCGVLTFHFSTFAPDKYADDVFHWTGGYFDWEDNGQRKWYSAIQTLEARVEPSTANGHPVLRGIKPLTMKEEFYFNLRFTPKRNTWQPLWTVPALEGREPDGRVVAWACQRDDGGRGFGTTCGHFYDNWKHSDFRKLILNALVWTAKGEVPPGGVEARFYSHQEIAAALSGVEGQEPAVLDDRPIRALIFAGNEAHKWHNWEKTTAAIRSILEQDPRFQVEVSLDIEDLGRKKLGDYQVVIQNYANWLDPTPLSDGSKKAFVDYLSGGGGLVLIHFANGAFHFSLPQAGGSDWPEYRKIARRVWNHQGEGQAKSGHDAFGPFTVKVTPVSHPITQGLSDFPVTDELYFNQDGKEPIEPLIVARSNVTGRDEPLAWTYTYGQGRVFQSLLGHSEKTYDTFEAAEMIYRAAAWVSRRPVIARPKEAIAAVTSPKSPPAATPRLVEGRFGKALDASAGGLMVRGQAAYRQPPLTVECWAKLHQRATYNILVANELKSSATHWELFTMAGDGKFTAYLPGLKPDHVRSDANICDSQWHYLAMVFEPMRVRLYVDGRMVADQAVEFQKGATVAGDFALGQLVGRELGCDGQLDEVRLSRIARTIDDIPDRSYSADNDTLGLWHFDVINSDGASPDDSSTMNAARAALAAAAPERSVGPDHWGVESVGFRWTEDDSRDGRWQQMNIGRCLASILPLPEGPVRKGLSIRLGSRQEAAVCYDTEFLRLRAAWLGDFLTFDPARYGIINPPRIAGTLLLSQPEGPAWVDAPVRYDGMYRHGPRVVLAYHVADTAIRESPWVEIESEQPIISRTLEIAPHNSPLTLNVLQATGAHVNIREQASKTLIRSDRNGRTTLIVVSHNGPLPAELTQGDPASVQLKIPANTSSVRIQIGYWCGSSEDGAEMAHVMLDRAAPTPLDPLYEPGPRQWPDKLHTNGKIGSAGTAYVVDTIELPFSNPYNALFFVGGHDFFSNGDIALCTVHGDVWRASGIDADLHQIHWQRVATGLFQPLGLRIINDQVFVLGRDQITRLHDRDDDGEADYYENFFNGLHTSPNGHDFVAALESDASGNLYFLHATQGVVRVARDGSSMEVLATGLRNPVALSVGPDGTITASPQEGEWTPGSNIVEVKPGRHFGYGGPKEGPERPLGYDPPLCWIQRMQDNSSGGQAWVTSDRWGPMVGQLLHFSFGKCRMMLVPRERIGDVVQGGAVDFPLDFDSGLLRGRFHPIDGQLYLSGMKGWVSSATQDGCLQRVRYTGGPIYMPIGVKTFANGLGITFSSPLDKLSAEDPDSYQLEAWNYRYSAAYGSLDWKISDSRQEGHDEVHVESATLDSDGRTVFLEVLNLPHAMQMKIAFAITSADGHSLRQSFSYTLNAIGTETRDPTRLTRRPRAGQLSAEAEARLIPGLVFRYRSIEKNGRDDGYVDVRNQRTASLYVPEGSDTTSILTGRPIQVRAEGFVRVPLRDDYRFRLVANGNAKLNINGKLAAQSADSPGGDTTSQAVTLHKGYNHLELEYEPANPGPAQIQTFWSHPNFAEEPIPPTALFCDGQDSSLERFRHLREGRQLVATLNCHRCHGLTMGSADQPADQPMDEPPLDRRGLAVMPELLSGAPDLRGIGSRLNPNWMATWILAPQSMKSDCRMPTLISSAAANSRNMAADLAAYLSSATAGETLPSTEGPDGSSEGDTGRVLFEDLGCIGCHRLTHPDDPDEFARVSLWWSNVKYEPGALEAYLQAPHRFDHGTRMPDFHLTDQESRSIATWLRSEAKGTLDEWPELSSANAQRGEALFSQLRCHACHQIQNQVAVKSIPIHSADRGCLMPRAERPVGLPRFTIGDRGRQAILEFLNSRDLPLVRDVPQEASERLAGWLRCGACHSRDGAQSPRVAILIDEGTQGTVPELIPNLTWSGDKLRGRWLEQLLLGQLDYRPRPWMKGRMPSFPGYGSWLAEGLVHEHGLPVAAASPNPKLDNAVEDAVEDGRRLMLPSALDCRQCHAVGSEQPRGDKGTQIALGINFAHVRERLNHDYYLRFVLDPPRYDINSKMPKLATEQGATKVTSICSGNAIRQFESIWQYIQTLPSPKGIEINER